MIQSKYPDVIILPLVDMRSDVAWSNQIDNKINEVFLLPIDVTIYGGRDSFIPYYHGKFKIFEIPEHSYNSGTEIRQRISEGEYYNSEDFRAGCIYTTFQQYTNPKVTVDVAIFNNDYSKILLARKPFEDKYRFVGGFVDVTDTNLEQTVRREVAEECNIEIDAIQYVASSTIDDWRYVNEKSKILTVFFKAKIIFGKIIAGDDIIELKWHDISELTSDDFMPEHVVLFEKLI